MTYRAVVFDALVDSREVDERTVTGGASYRAVDAFSASDDVARLASVRGDPELSWRTRDAAYSTKHELLLALKAGCPSNVESVAAGYLRLAFGVARGQSEVRITGLACRTVCTSLAVSETPIAA